MKIVVLNAGPMAGKDTIADELVRHIGSNIAVKTEMKEALIEAAVRMAGISRELWDTFYDRRYKERPNPFLIINGIQSSPRQWLIHNSENVFKPMFGNDVFGKRKALIISQWKGDQTTFIFPDGGFIEELNPLISLCGQENFYLARIHKDGCGFAEGGDSRSYLYLPKGTGHQDDFTNVHGYLDSCVADILDFIGE